MDGLITFLEFLGSDSGKGTAELLTIIVSFVGSWIIARRTSRHETKQLKLSWKREDKQFADHEYAQLFDAVMTYASNGGMPEDYAVACAKIAIVRSRETGELAEKLDVLFSSLKGPGSNLDTIAALVLDLSVSKSQQIKK